MNNRFLYFSDSHYGATPVGRSDDYNQAILDKFEYVLKLAKKNDCIILFGGDLFDKPKINYFVLNPLIKLLMKYIDVKIYALHGNEGHDGSVDSSPLTLLRMLGLVHMKPFHDFGDTRVLFCHHGINMDESEQAYDPDKVNILMTHQTIVKTAVIFDHILYEDLNLKSEILTVAHYHPYQGIEKVGNTTIIAPGSISRRKRTKDAIEKEPKCVLIKVDGKKFTTKELIVPHAKDVWIQKKEFDLEKDEIFEEIKSNVNSMRDVLMIKNEFPDILDSLKDFAKKIDVEQDVMDFVQERLKHV